MFNSSLQWDGDHTLKIFHGMTSVELCGRVETLTSIQCSHSHIFSLIHPYGALALVHLDHSIFNQQNSISGYPKQKIIWAFIQPPYWLLYFFDLWLLSICLHTCISMDYKLYEISTKRLIISHDVTFHEDEFPFFRQTIIES